MVKICNMDCFNCKYADCINNRAPSKQEMEYMEYIDEEIIDKELVGISDDDYNYIMEEILNGINWTENQGD